MIIPEGIISIEETAFFNCSSLNEVTIPNSVAFIGEKAFTNSGIKSVVIQNGVEKIGKLAFYDCTELRTLTIPSSIKSVEEKAFDGTRIQEIYYDGTQEQWNDILIKTGNERLDHATLHLSTKEQIPVSTPLPTDVPVSTVSPSPVIGQNRFMDVVPNDFFFDAVEWAVNHIPQITTGTSANTFSPYDSCTRAQMVTFLWRAAGCPEPITTESFFTDVSPEAYYNKAVLWAVEKNITTGTSVTTFEPDLTVNRAQAVTFLWRLDGGKKVMSQSSFVDVPVGRYYSDAVHWAAEHGITTGTTSYTFEPDAYCLRAQIVTFLWRAMA